MGPARMLPLGKVEQSRAGFAVPFSRKRNPKYSNHAAIFIGGNYLAIGNQQGKQEVTVQLHKSRPCQLSGVVSCDRHNSSVAIEPHRNATRNKSFLRASSPPALSASCAAPRFIALKHQGRRACIRPRAHMGEGMVKNVYQGWQMKLSHRLLQPVVMAHRHDLRQ